MLKNASITNYFVCASFIFKCLWQSLISFAYLDYVVMYSKNVHTINKFLSQKKDVKIKNIEIQPMFLLINLFIKCKIVYTAL